MSINDKVFTKLGELGYVGSLPDRMLGKLKDDYGVSNINEGFYKAGGLKSFVSGLLDVSYVARLDGVSQYFRFDGGLNVKAGSKVRFDFKPSASETLEYFNLIFYGVDSDIVTSFYGKIRTLGNSGFLDGVAIVNDNTLIPTDEQWHTFEFTIGSDKTITSLAGSSSGSCLGGVFKSFRVLENDIVVNEIPLTNKEQGYEQLPSIGDVSVFIVNFSTDIWEAE